MKIVTRKTDGAVVLVADCDTSQFDLGVYNIYNIPGWDWSLVNLGGVDQSQPGWIYCQMEWNGNTLSQRNSPLPPPN